MDRPGLIDDRVIAKKIAWRLAPLLMACYFVAFLDGEALSAHAAWGDCVRANLAKRG